VTAPDDTADVDAGRRACEHCGTEAHPAAAVVEPASGPGGAEPAHPGSAVVEMQVFGRSVRVEAPEQLEAVAITALQLWSQLGDPVHAPVGASGFVMVEQPGPPPLEMDTPLIYPTYTEEPETSRAA
jgi:hypothetical protein